MIRLGNFFNSEIIGNPATIPWAVRFTRIDPLPRHPVQLYESLVYLLLFLTLFPLRKTLSRQVGRASGYVLSVIFIARFGLEYLKSAQEEYILSLPLNMGQLLSLPFIALGLWLWLRPGPRKKEKS
jgi:prolipoprotein diacylglyceryltransferase